MSFKRFRRFGYTHAPLTGLSHGEEMLNPPVLFTVYITPLTQSCDNLQRPAHIYQLPPYCTQLHKVFPNMHTL